MHAASTATSHSPLTCTITSMSCAQKVGGKGVAKAVMSHWLAYRTGGMPWACGSGGGGQQGWRFWSKIVRWPHADPTPPHVNRR